MSCDKLVFDLAQEIEGSANVFIRKDWLNIIDNMNTNYASNQSIVDTSQLANSNKYLSYRESYLQLPLLLTLLGPGQWSGQQATAGNFAPAPGNGVGANGVGADYILGLKS